MLLRVQSEALDGVATGMGEVRSQIEQYVAGGRGDLAPLDAAVYRAEAMAGSVLTLFPPALPADASAAVEIIRRMRASAGQHVSRLEADVRSASESWSSDVSEAKSCLEEAQADTRRWREDLEGQVAGLRETLQGVQEQTSGAADTMRADFDAAEEHREAASREATEERLSSFDESARQAREDVAEKLTQALSDAEATMGAIEELHEQVKVTAGLTGNAALVGGYDREAEEERKEASKLRRSAGGWLIAGAILSVVIFGEALWASGWKLSSIGVGAAILRLGVFLPFLAVSGYYAHESSIHRHRERNARRLELHLASLDPFLADLPDEEKVAVKKDLVTDLYVEDDGPKPQRSLRVGGGPNLPKAAERVIEMVLDRFVSKA